MSQTRSLPAPGPRHPWTTVCSAVNPPPSVYSSYHFPFRQATTSTSSTSARRSRRRQNVYPLPRPFVWAVCSSLATLSSSPSSSPPGTHANSPGTRTQKPTRSQRRAAFRPRSSRNCFRRALTTSTRTSTTCWRTPTSTPHSSPVPCAPPASRPARARWSRPKFRVASSAWANRATLCSARVRRC